MKIKKVLNNNVVITENEQQQELVVMGRGLSFQKKVGQSVDESKIEKTFVLQNTGTSEKLVQLLKYTSEKYLDIASEILEYAQAELPYKLDEYLYVALTDHISFALSRQKQGIQLKNNLLYEIRKYYNREYEIGVKSLGIIEEHTGIRLDEDEAGSIALHLVNSQISGDNMETAVQVTGMVNNILNIVKYHYQMKLDDASINYERFITHLRYFSIRFIRKEKMEDTVDDFMFEQVQRKYEKAYACTEKINIYLNKNFNWSLSRDEQVYLTVHIHRVTYRQQNTS
ncbi:BglG family transcription antiterminator LicT [Sediminibacillus albus]|uniref:Beta-glucoside operon transcriptional antiterminator n=1 Tax=Sediminibacillus albus TaxID=407036 RepID=A0A1G8Y787_9BACI|nr:PRD domain-containing protein [Sediminibacillus albus]SDJ98611.1 beta-glucoside operon transcriptional antiterminator [Sediminibacillus albus]